MAKAAQASISTRLRANTLPMVGRDGELATLARKLSEAAASRSGSVTLVSGEPGIGKSRLLAEAALLAPSLGFLVVAGNCYRAEGTLPYRPWIEILTGLGAEPDSVLFSGLNALAADDLTRLVPELAAEESGAAPSPAPGGDRLRLMDSVATALLQAAARRPLTLLIEDLHWADAPSAQLLAHLSRRLDSAPLVVVVSYREGEIGPKHPLTPTLAEFSERRSASRVNLSGLTGEHVRALVALYTGQPAAPISERFVWGLLSVTEGNPYFIEEVLRHLQETGKVFAADGSLLEGSDPFTRMSVPRDLRHVLAQRIERLSDQAAGALQAAAILGRRFEFEALREMTSLPEAVLLASMEEAMAARMVVDLGSGQFEFEHALTQRALTESIATPRKQRMHLGAAQALEKLFGNQPDRWAAAIAFHYREAGLREYVDEMVAYARLALEAAERRYAWESFSWQFEETLRALDELSAPPLTRARFICDIVYPRYNLSSLPFDQLRNWARSAGAVLLDAGDRTNAARMRQVEGYTYQSSAFRRMQNLGEALRLFEEAEVLTEDAGLRAALVASKPNVLHQMGRTAEADAIAYPMTASSNIVRKSWGFSYHGHYSVHLGNVAEGLGSFERAVEASAGSPLAISASSTALQWQSICCLTWLRAPNLVEPLHRKEMSRKRADAWQTRVGRISVATAARQRGAVSVESPRDFLGANGDQADMEVAAWLFYDGEWDLAVATLIRIVDELTDKSALQLLAHGGYSTGELLRAAGRWAEAEARLNDSFLSPNPTNNIAGHAALGLLTAELGRFEEAAAHAAACRAAMTDDDWLGLGARVRLVEALAALARGERPLAESAFAEAIADFQRVEHPWDDAEAHRLFGKVLVERGEHADSVEHFRLALGIYERIQAAEPFVARVLAHWPNGIERPARAGVAGTSVANGGGLSARELEVLNLLARGFSNRRIGESLVISEPTVATHVRHILEKTGTANRAEAAAWAIRNGLE